MREISPSVRSYIQFVLDMMQVSPRGLAMKAGIAPTTLTRFLNDDDHKFLLSSRTLDKIGNVSGLSVAQFMSERFFEREAAFANAKLNAIRGELPPNLPVDIPYISEPGVWIEKETYRSRKILSEIGLPSTTGSDEYFYTLVRGNSVNKYAGDGEYLYCKRMDWDGKFSMKGGQIYIIERQSIEGTMVECSARRLSVFVNSLFLEYASAEPELENSVTVLDQEAATASSLRILGFACSVVRRLGPRLYTPPDSA